MDLVSILLLILFGVSSAARASKKKKEALAKHQLSQQAAARRKPAQARPQAMARSVPAQPAIQPPVMPADDAERAFEPLLERDGSIEMPPLEPHEHEGKPLPCPAEEREMPRPRPVRVAAAQQSANPAGMQLPFTASSVVQAVMMSEVLKRPEFKNGRRVIR